MFLVESDLNLEINKILWVARLLNMILSSHKNMPTCKKSAPFDTVWHHFTPFGPVWPGLALPLKFGQNWVSNSWDIPNIDKCRLDKCCRDKCHRDSWDVLGMVPGTYVWSLVKIESVTAEMLLTLSLVWWWVVVVLSYFRVKPKPRLG